ncbi:ALF repeat-containing protein, partial [Actinophytocola gossypii]
RIHWTMDLRGTVLRTMGDPGAGANVQAAAQEALDEGSVDTFLTFLNHGLYVARALDACAAQPA